VLRAAFSVKRLAHHTSLASWKDGRCSLVDLWWISGEFIGRSPA
jgi:hypothetical protein